MRSVKFLTVLWVVITLVVLGVVSRPAKADGQFPDYQILVNTSGVGLPDFPEAIAGRNVMLQAWRAGSVGGMGGIGTSRWNFGDGSQGDATSEFIWHTFAQPGTYHVVVDVYASMGTFLWHWEQDIPVYALWEGPALNVSSTNGVTTTVVYDAPTITGDPTAQIVDFSGPCDATSFLSWNGNNTPFDAPRVSMNRTLYVTAKGLGVTGEYHFYACSTGPGRTDPISPVAPSRQLVISVTAPLGGSANLHINEVFLLWKSAAPAVSDDNVIVRPPKKGGIRLPIAR